ncbi:DNA alkylation repair protein [Candidatus Saccharibacteria bacterium]|nr:DNA alkylation repair protein [Candidatus Saccharibacteria bacterium]
MNAKTLMAEITNTGDTVRAKGSMRFFKTGKGEYGEGDQFVGVTMPEIRKICKKYRKLDIENLGQLFRSPIHEHRVAAVVIMADTFKKASPARQDDLFNLYLQALRNKQINNWDMVDISCPHVIGEYLLDKPVDILYELAKSENLWERRTAIISTFTFLRDGDATHSLRLAELLLRDKHDLMHKAVGWVLREVGKKFGQETLTVFLDKHAKTMPRTALRYAIEKLEPELRRKYLAK